MKDLTAAEAERQGFVMGLLFSFCIAYLVFLVGVILAGCA